MSRIRADQITNSSASGPPTASNGLVVNSGLVVNNGLNVSGVVTATAFDSNTAVVSSITATTGTFSGNVSVGGTLTYEDVTNVDSVGMITARKGIQVLADGINAVGVVTATSFSGDGSNLSGVESGVANFVATGTISNGATVIINADGTTSVVSGTSGAEGKGSFATADTDNSQVIEVTSAGTGEVVMIYNDGGNNNYSTACVATVSGTSITFGTPVAFNSTDTEQHAITYDPNSDKVVVIYRAHNLAGKDAQVRIGTISGTSISFGTAVNFDNYMGNPSGCFDSTNNKIIICYRDGNNGNYGTGIVGTVSDTSISFGSAQAYNSDDSEFRSVCFIGDSQVVDVFSNNGDNSKGYAVVGTVSGTSINFGTHVKFTDDQNVRNLSATYDSDNDKVVIIYSDGSGNRKSMVGTVTGTGASATITFGSATTFGQTSSNLTTAHMHSVYNTFINKVVVAYRDGDNSDKGTVALGTVSDNSITFTSGFVYEDDGYVDFNWPANVPGGDQNVFIGYRDQNDTSDARGVIYQAPYSATNVTAENYIGIAAEAIADGATGKVNILGGINTGQTGLTTAKTHYVQGDGSLATTAANPSVVAGTAISDTKILVR